MKKYELVQDDKICVFGETLYRIRALINFCGINAGDIGGYIAGEYNLSHEGDAWVCGNAKVCGNSLVYGDPLVCGNAKVCDNARVCGNAKVCGDALVFGNVRVCGNAWVCGDAAIFKPDHIVAVGPIGSRNEYTTFYRNKSAGITVKCGCFLGGMDEFLKKVFETHGNSKHAEVYRIAAELAQKQIGSEEEK